MNQPAPPEFQPPAEALPKVNGSPRNGRIPPGMFRPRGVLAEAGFLSGATFLLLLGFIIFGWLCGSIYKEVQDYSDQKTLQKALAAGGIDPQVLLRVAERKANLNPGDPEAQLALAKIYFALAEANPAKGERQALYVEAAEAARTAWIDLRKRQPGAVARLQPGSPAFDLRFQQANILAQAGREREAVEIYDTLCNASKGEKTYLRANLLNSLAWLLATAREAGVRDPEKAHALAVECIKLLPAASRNPAFLDTLAMTYFLKGDYGQAVTVEKEALARARSDELYLLLQNFDLFKKAAATANAN